MSLVRSATTVGSYTVLSRILGFVRDALMASILGVSGATDAFFIAFKLPNFFRRFFAEGAFSSAFVPLFSGWLVKHGKDHAQHTTRHVFTFMTAGLVVLVILFEIFMPWVIKILAPGFIETPDRFQLAVELSRITFPYILFISLAALFSGMLNAVDKFAAAAAVPILLNIFMICGLALSIFYTGQDSYILAWAVFFAGIAQLVMVWRHVSRQGFSIKLLRPRLSADVKRVGRLTLPAALGAGVVQINLFVGVMFASLLPTGAVSYLFYADRLNQLPLAIIGIAISTALLPQLSKKIKAGHMEAAMETQNRSLEFAMGLTLPATSALIVLAYPLVLILFERGEFFRVDTIATSSTLIAYVVGLPAYVLVKLLSVPFFAREDTKRPAQAAAISVGVNLAFNILLMGPMSYVGLALATALASWVNAALLGYWLVGEGWFHMDTLFKKRMIRLLLASLALGFALWGFSEALMSWIEDGIFWKLAFILGAVILGLVFYGLALILLDVVNIKDMTAAFKKYTRK